MQIVIRAVFPVAGITDLVFVIGRTMKAIENHFDHSLELEAKAKDDMN